MLANVTLNSNPGEFKECDAYGLSMLMIQNWTGNGAQISLNPSLWTIPVEIALYIFYPVSLFIRSKFKLSVSIAFALFLAAASFALFTVGNHQSFASLLLYVVIWNSGAWLAEAYQEGKIPKIANFYCVSLIIALTGLVMLAGFFDVNAYYLTCGWGLIAFLLMIWSLGVGSSMLSLGHWFTRFMVFIGTISYSLYLVHYPLFKLLGHIWIQLFGTKPVSFLIPSLATVVAIPISFLFYVYFEKPSHEISKRLARPS